ncbi:MAG: helix-turn-helix transcriptional regulator [Proteobacteria bacterium]|jgi:transcriptional regulator with XRE-family HTH domain|nr:helix-turn-helix transcriptional regulator [Pseudomonadota bacterium]
MNAHYLGQLIQARRRELGISQRDLSELSVVSLHSLSDIESGKGNPVLNTLLQILEPLGLELTVQLRQLP